MGTKELLKYYIEQGYNAEALKLIDDFEHEAYKRGEYEGMCNAYERVGILPSDLHDIDRGKKKVKLIAG